MRILITAGPTHEPIDPVRYLGNRSSGQMGKSLAESASRGGHAVTLVLGPVSLAFPSDVRRLDVETSGEMYDTVLSEFPAHDLLLMAAAVADYRPRTFQPEKMERNGMVTLELEATPDILAAAGQIKRGDQRTVGFSLGGENNLEKAREKLERKKVDLIVANPLETMTSEEITAILLWPQGRSEKLPCRSKADFADILLQRAVELFP